ncbi:MAG: portal protein [Verrucomicrobiota bacterium JB024]|nr:portal protein [Verrucomicrobiota bacterium JB024]
MTEAEKIVAGYETLKSARGGLDGAFDDVAFYFFPEKFEGKHGLDSMEVGEAARPLTSFPMGQALLLAGHLYANTFSLGNELFTLRAEGQEGDAGLDDEAKRWLSDTAKRALKAIQGSNFPDVVQQDDLNYVLFGTGAMTQELSKDGRLVFKAQSIYRNFYIQENAEGVVDACWMELTYTAQQASEKYGYEKLPAEVKQAYGDPSKVNETFAFLHFIGPNPASNPKKAHLWAKRAYKSVHIFIKDKTVIKRGGFDSFPWQCPRFYKLDGSPYGISPARICLPDVRELNAVEAELKDLSDLAARPPVFGPPALGSARIVPGAYIPVDSSDGGKIEFYPVQADLAAKLNQRSELREDIRERFLINMFLSLDPAVNPKEKTATEAQLMQSEKMQSITGVINRLMRERYALMIPRVVELMAKAGMLLQVPPGLRGKNYEVVYTSRIDSRLSQVEIDNLLGASEAIAQLEAMEQAAPGLGDVINTRKAKRALAHKKNVDSDLIYSEREVEEREQARAEALAQAQQQQAMSESMKPVDLQKPVEPGSMLEQLGALGGAAR